MRRSIRHSLSATYTSLDPSTRIFVRAWLFGYLAETAPSALKLLASSLVFNKFKGPSGRRSAAARSSSKLVRSLVDILGRAAGVRGLALFFAVALGGARWLDDYIYMLLCRSTVLVRRRWRRSNEPPLQNDSVDGSSLLPSVNEDKLTEQDCARLHRFATFSSTLVSSSVAFTLQNARRNVADSSRSAVRSSLGSSSSASPASRLPLVSLNIDDNSTPTNNQHLQYSPTSPSNYESSTLDFTLFLLVRAMDASLRKAFVKSRASHQPALRWMADRGDVAVFVLSAWRIMWVWFYKPWLLPPSYNS